MAIKRADVRKIFGDTEITDEQMSNLMGLIHTEVDGIKEERDSLREQLDEANKPSEFEGKYNDLKKEFDAYKQDQEAKEVAKKKRDALKELLKDSNLSEKGQERALKYADLNSIELDKDGSVKDGKKHIDGFHAEWSDYVTKNEQNPTPTPGAGAGGGENNVFANMSLADKMKYASENPNSKEVAEWLAK